MPICYGCATAAHGFPRMGRFTRIASDAATGVGGRVAVTADRIELLDGGSFRAATFGSGSGGSIRVDAGRLQIDGGNSPLNFNEDTGRDQLTFTGITTTSVFGASGVAAGAIDIAADTVELVDDGVISSDALGGGAAGDITLSGVQRLLIDGRGTDQDTSISSGTLLSPGDGGDIRIVGAGEVVVRNGAQMLTSSFSSIGRAGTIEIEADRLLLVGGDAGGLTALRSSSLRIPSLPAALVGAGGDISVTARHVELQQGAQIAVDSETTAPSGSIALRGLERLVLRNSAITAATAVADAGTITIVARHLVDLQNSRITTSAADGEGGGGNIRIDPDFVILDDSDIVARGGARPRRRHHDRRRAA